MPTINELETVLFKDEWEEQEDQPRLSFFCYIHQTAAIDQPPEDITSAYHRLIKKINHLHGQLAETDFSREMLSFELAGMIEDARLTRSINPALRVLATHVSESAVFESVVREGGGFVKDQHIRLKLAKQDSVLPISDWNVDLDKAQVKHGQIAGWFLEQHPQVTTIFCLSDHPVSMPDLTPFGAGSPSLVAAGGPSWTILSFDHYSSQYHHLVLDAMNGNVLSNFAGKHAHMAISHLLVASIWWILLKIIALVTAFMALVLVVGLAVEAAAAGALTLGAYLLTSPAVIAAIVLATTQVIGWLINLLREMQALLPPARRQVLQNQINRLQRIENRLDDPSRTPQQKIQDIKDAMDTIEDALDKARDEADHIPDPEDRESFKRAIQDLMQKAKRAGRAYRNHLDQVPQPR